MNSSKAANKAIVVIQSAKELIVGITKLSGFRPLLKVTIETAKVNTAIAAKEIIFEKTRMNRTLEIF